MAKKRTFTTPKEKQVLENEKKSGKKKD